MVSEEYFLTFLQKEISIVIENKTIRQGKLLLFCIKDFYLIFTLLNNNVIKSFELPYPFLTCFESTSKNILLLDYKLNTLFKNVPIIKDSDFFTDREKHMKFFNNTVKIVETV